MYLCPIYHTELLWGSNEIIHKKIRHFISFANVCMAFPLITLISFNDSLDFTSSGKQLQAFTFFLNLKRYVHTLK